MKDRNDINKITKEQATEIFEQIAANQDRHNMRVTISGSTYYKINGIKTVDGQPEQVNLIVQDPAPWTDLKNSKDWKNSFSGDINAFTTDGIIFTVNVSSDTAAKFISLAFDCMTTKANKLKNENGGKTRNRRTLDQIRTDVREWYKNKSIVIIDGVARFNETNGGKALNNSEAKALAELVGVAVDDLGICAIYTNYDAIINGYADTDSVSDGETQDGV